MVYLGGFSRSLNQIGYVHRHLFDARVVEELNVFEDALVLGGEEVDGHAFAAETSTTSNSVEEKCKR